MKRKIANAITKLAFIVAGASVMALDGSDITIPICSLIMSLVWIYLVIMISNYGISIDPELHRMHLRIERGEENKKGSEGDCDTDETA